jgi:hypothetical protein
MRSGANSHLDRFLGLEFKPDATLFNSCPVLSVRFRSGRLQSLIQRYQAAEARIVGGVMDIFRGNRDVKIHAIERIAQLFGHSADQLINCADRPINVTLRPTN